MQSLYTISGIVNEGNKRGKNLGFPTANVALSEKIPSGIYMSLTSLDSHEYPSLTFIGEAKTFDEHVFQSETWILDFDRNLYGKELSIQLVKKIRENHKFDSAEALIVQMKEDEKKAREYFKESENPS